MLDLIPPINPTTVHGVAAVITLVLGTLIGRWLTLRSLERRAALARQAEERRDVLARQSERIATLEGRTDELSKANAALQQRLAQERVDSARENADLRSVVQRLENELVQARAELTAALTEIERLLAEIARLRAARETTMTPSTSDGRKDD